MIISKEKYHRRAKKLINEFFRLKIMQHEQRNTKREN